MRLIDADALKKEMCESTCNIQFTTREVCGKTCREQLVIDNAPTIEAEPVEHGRWEESGYRGMLACSVCRIYHISNGDEYDFTYCPHCGAKMDEVTP